MSDPATQTVSTANPLADAGLRCPRCDYNLTGLPEPRCPECGETFDWEAVRRAADNPPRIYFERVRGWRKVPGFFVTWATVLFAPWVFARQAVARVSAVHALVFVLVCLGGTFASLLFGADLGFVATWITTAVIYILLQAFIFCILDSSGWRPPLRSFRFWLLVGCYTSAIMLTEVVAGPPLLSLSDLWDMLAGQPPSPWVDSIFRLDWQSAISWGQMGFWAAGLACCYAVRVRHRRLSLGLAILAAVLVALLVVVLYAATFEHIGMSVYGWIDRIC